MIEYKIVFDDTPSITDDVISAMKLVLGMNEIKVNGTYKAFLKSKSETLPSIPILYFDCISSETAKNLVKEQWNLEEINSPSNGLILCH